MRVIELSLRNYRVFEAVELELPSRVIGVFGPNGGGKSTLMESIGVATHGLDFARTAKSQIRTHGLLTDCEIRMVFEHAGVEYEVRRVIKGKNHAADAELMARGAVLADGVTEVDAEIRRLLRMDRQVFRASVFAEQKQLDAFSDLTRAKRKEMVLRLLGIKPVDDARTAARQDARMKQRDVARIGEQLPDVAALEAERDRLGANAETADRQAETATSALAEASARSEEAERAFAAADEVRARAERVAALREAAAVELERLAKRASELDSRRTELLARIGELGPLREEREAIGDVTERLQAARDLAREADTVRGLESELEALPAVDGQAALQEYEAAEAERGAAQQAAAEAAAAARLAEQSVEAARRAVESADRLDPSEPCPTCRQPLTDAFEDYVAHRRADLERAEREAAAAVKASKDAAAGQSRADGRWKAARAAAEAAQTALSRRAQVLDALDAARVRFEPLAAALDGRPPDLDGLQAQAARGKELDGQLARLEGEAEQMKRLEADLASASQDSAECRSRIDAFDRESAGLAFDAEEHARVAKERAEARELLEQAGVAEREAAARAREAAAALAHVDGALAQARETVARLGAVREEAHYVERVGLLLDGFRDHLVGRIGPELSREAEALFRELTNHEYEDLKISDDDLAIQIADGGAYFDIERFSGSETDLANLALRVAISVHLSRMSGADVGMMVLDEVLGALDAERKDLMVQALGRLAGRFHQLFVVTHAEQIKDQFPASIEVQKVGRRRSEAMLV